MAITKPNSLFDPYDALKHQDDVFSFGNGANGSNIGAINAGPSIGSTTTAPVWMNPNAAMHTTEHHIQGQKIIVDHNMSELQFLAAGETTVKETLVNKLAQSMFQGRCIEFTKMQDPVTHEYRFVARIFVVPDTQVRILREHKII